MKEMLLKRKGISRVLSAVIFIVMCMSVMPVTAFAAPPLLEKVELTAPKVPVPGSTCGQYTGLDYLLQEVNTGNPGVIIDIDNSALLKMLPDENGVMDYRPIRHSNVNEQKYGKSEYYEETFTEGEYQLQIYMESHNEGFARGLTIGSMNGYAAELGGNQVANPFFMFYNFKIFHKDKRATQPNTNPTQHWYGTCSGCNTLFDLADHTFKTIIDKPATTSEDGSKHEECSVCGYKKSSEIIPRHIHEYAGGLGYYIQQADSEYHWRFCSTCHEQEKSEHTFDLGKITKQPTTIEVGEKVYTCTACQWVKKEIIPKLGDPVKTVLHEPGTALAIEDCVFSVKEKAESVEYRMPLGNSVTVKIPSTVAIDGVNYKVTAIADGAFKKNTHITSVEIGPNVTTIGEDAFSGCKNLNKVTLGSNVSEIGNRAFAGCSALTEITIPASVKTIGVNAFEGCTKLKFMGNQVLPTNTSKDVSNQLKAQVITTAKIKSYKVKDLKKKNVVLNLKAKSSGNGKLTYTNSTAKKLKKYIAVSKKGKVTIKKGAKKGKYNITIVAAKTDTYNKVKKTITIKVK